MKSNIRNMPRNSIRLPHDPNECVRVAPGTDLRDVPPDDPRSVTHLLRAENREAESRLGIFEWALGLVMLAAWLALCALGGE